MKKITLSFLTKQGEEAYRNICAEGENQPTKDKKIIKAVYKEKIISDDPLKIEIKIKIGWLADSISLDDNIKAGLIKYNAKENIDFSMVVV